MLKDTVYIRVWAEMMVTAGKRHEIANYLDKVSSFLNL